MNEADRDFLVTEIRLNRTAIADLSKETNKKVGRGELFGWLSAVGGIVALVLAASGG